MALTSCYECSKEISDKAPACPHCGAPKKKGALGESDISEVIGRDGSVDPLKTYAT